MRLRKRKAQERRRMGSILIRRDGEVFKGGRIRISQDPRVWRIVTDPKQRAEDRLGKTLGRARKEYGDDVVGFILWMRLPKVIYAHGGYVDPEWRGRGFSKRMERELEGIARGEKVSRIGLTSASIPREKFEQGGYKAHSIFHPYSIIGWFGRFYSKRVK